MNFADQTVIAVRFKVRKPINAWRLISDAYTTMDPGLREKPAGTDAKNGYSVWTARPPGATQDVVIPVGALVLYYPLTNTATTTKLIVKP